MAPLSVCVQEQLVHVDGEVVATALLCVAHIGFCWSGCHAGYSNSELVLLSGTNPASFDRRYLGSIDASAVLGAATPMWT